MAQELEQSAPAVVQGPQKVQQNTPGSDLKKMSGVAGARSKVPVGIETFAHLMSMVKGIMHDYRTKEERDAGAERVYFIEDFDETKSHRLVLYEPLAGSVFFDVFQTHTGGKIGTTFGLSLFQQLRADKTSRTERDGLLSSCALLRKTTGWMRVYGASPDFLEELGLKFSRGNIFVRLHPPVRGERFFESTIEFFHPERKPEDWETYLLSELVNENLIIRPMDEDDKLYFDGLSDLMGLTTVVNDILPTMKTPVHRAPRKAQPFPMLPQPTLPAAAPAPLPQISGPDNDSAAAGADVVNLDKRREA